MGPQLVHGISLSNTWSPHRRRPPQNWHSAPAGHSSNPILGGYGETSHHTIQGGFSNLSENRKPLERMEACVKDGSVFSVMLMGNIGNMLLSEILQG